MRGCNFDVLAETFLFYIKRIGWVGKNADDYHMHTFTDESGAEKCGLSVTIREEVSNVCITMLKDLRQTRKSAATIRNFYKNYIQKLPQELKRSKKHSKKGTVGSSLIASSIRRLSDPVSDRLDGSRSNKRRNSATSIEATTPKPVVSDNDFTFHKSSVRNKAKDSYRCMLRNERLGETCIVEKCFVFVGTKGDEQSLMLCALKHLVDHERMVRFLKLVPHFRCQLTQ